MSWHTSTRATRLPPNWQTIRTHVITRAHGQCQATTHAPHCNGHATDVDHITPGDNHNLNNLQALSRACHKQKTAQENTQNAKRRAQMRKKPTEKHPGQK